MDYTTFTVTYGCGNCLRNFTKTFSKGEKAPRNGVDCPHCGTHHDTAKKF